MLELQQKFGYVFRDETLLLSALTHSSYANEGKDKIGSYERLEFLGDSLLGFICAEYLYMDRPDTPEGDLTKSRAAVVCEKALCAYSKELGLGRHIRFSKGEAASGGGTRPSILADIFEAVLAAIYLDGGMEPAKAFVLPILKKSLNVPKSSLLKDYKTALQEILQQNPEEHFEYVLLGESGPEHNKKFTCAVKINNNTVSKGIGRTKKEAEQQAAHAALTLLGY